MAHELEIVAPDHVNHPAHGQWLAESRVEVTDHVRAVTSEGTQRGANAERTSNSGRLSHRFPGNSRDRSDGPHRHENAARSRVDDAPFLGQLDDPAPEAEGPPEDELKRDRLGTETVGQRHGTLFSADQLIHARLKSRPFGGPYLCFQIIEETPPAHGLTLARARIWGNLPTIAGRHCLSKANRLSSNGQTRSKRLKELRKAV